MFQEVAILTPYQNKIQIRPLSIAPFAVLAPRPILTKSMHTWTPHVYFFNFIYFLIQKIKQGVVVRTGTSVPTQDVVPYFKGLIHVASYD